MPACQPDQLVALTTEAFPGETFTGRIVRIAPVFRTATRQARVEMTIDNPRHRLKPGMFIQAAGRARPGNRCRYRPGAGPDRTQRPHRGFRRQ